MPGQRRRVFPLITAAFAVPAAVAAAAAQYVVVTSGGPAPAARYVVARADGPAPDAATLGRLVADRMIARPLPPGVGSERGLQRKTILAERAISARFPQITHIGGVRPDAMHWHPDGLAIDVMIPDYATADGKELGDRIMAFAFENAARFGIVHVIWQQTYYPAEGTPHLMPDLGSADANHYTHVHIATVGGGYPVGDETYVG